MNVLRLAAAAILSLAAIAAPPHAVFGPLDIRRGDAIQVDLVEACNVYALDSFNYEQYKKGRKFQYSGGLAKVLPFIVKPPRGTYFVVVDSGGGTPAPTASVRVVRAR